jgi:hypothetical protein
VECLKCTLNWGLPLFSRATRAARRGLLNAFSGRPGALFQVVRLGWLTLLEQLEQAAGGQKP